MVDKNNGGPAFPTVTSREAYTGDHFRTVHDAENGMSLRDYFAGQVIAGIHARDVFDAGQATPQQRAHLAYIDADALLAERAK